MSETELDLVKRTFNDRFSTFAALSSAMVGSAWSFIFAFFAVVGWALAGPWFHYSDTWQLIINTTSSVATFLIAFLIQNTQNRDAKVFQLKLNELIRAVHSASNDFIGLEGLPDSELRKIEQEFAHLREHYGESLSHLHRVLREFVERERIKRGQRKPVLE